MKSPAPIQGFDRDGDLIVASTQRNPSWNDVVGFSVNHADGIGECSVRVARTIGTKESGKAAGVEIRLRGVVSGHVDDFPTASRNLAVKYRGKQKCCHK